jgi:hypothetical protein
MVLSTSVVSPNTIYLARATQTDTTKLELWLCNRRGAYCDHYARRKAFLGIPILQLPFVPVDYPEVASCRLLSENLFTIHPWLWSGSAPSISGGGLRAHMAGGLFTTLALEIIFAMLYILQSLMRNYCERICACV